VKLQLFNCIGGALRWLLIFDSDYIVLNDNNNNTIIIIYWQW